MTTRTSRTYPILAVVVACLAGAVYLWSVRNGSAHNYYTPAAVGMAQDIGNFIFGSYDTGGFAGIDKIPGALWPQAASVAVFGYSTWAVLVPQAIASALTVLLTYAVTARWLGRPTGLAAAVAYAATPLVTALAQTNVPEPWFGLWLAVAAYLAMRAVTSPARGLWWLIAAACAVGAAFQVKMLEAWILVPALFVPYLVAAAPRLRTRVWHILVAGCTALVASLWWVVLVSVVPASQRPWVGGSNSDSAWEMVFGYNGLGRFGIASERSFVADFAGSAGLSRLIGPQLAVDVGWFLPLALVALVVGLVVTARRPRVDVERAGLLLFGLWLVPSVLVLAFAEGIHTFYVLLYAMPSAVLAAAGARQAIEWCRAGRRWPLMLGLAAQSAWTAWLVVRSHDNTWVLAVIAVATVVALLGFALRWTSFGIAVAAVAVLAAPVVWAAGATGPVNTINPSAGPATMGGPGGGGPGGGGPGGGGPARPVGGGGPARPVGGDALEEWLASHPAGSRYLVATDSRTAGTLILGGLSGVMAMGGGFDGSDPTPTAAELSNLVSSGQLGYVLQGQDRAGMSGPGGGPGGAPGGGSSAATAVTAERDAWIAEHCTAVTDAPTTSGTLLSCTAT